MQVLTLPDQAKFAVVIAVMVEIDVDQFRKAQTRAVATDLGLASIRP